VNRFGVGYFGAWIGWNGGKYVYSVIYEPTLDGIFDLLYWAGPGQSLPFPLPGYTGSGPRNPVYPVPRPPDYTNRCH
jgi:hypothetical protein